MAWGNLCSLSVTCDLEIQEGLLGITVVERRCQIIQQPPTWAASMLLLLFPSPRAARSRPSPRHFVATVTLTLNSQVGWCWGRDAEAVARTAGVFPSILRLDPEDDKGAVDEDAHSELQITAKRHRRFVTLCCRNTPAGQGSHHLYIFC